VNTAVPYVNGTSPDTGAGPVGDGDARASEASHHDSDGESGEEAGAGEGL